MVKLASVVDYELEEGKKPLILKNNPIHLFSLYGFQLDLIGQTFMSGSPPTYLWATMGEQMWGFDYYVLLLFHQSALCVNQNKSLDYNMAKKK